MFLAARLNSSRDNARSSYSTHTNRRDLLPSQHLIVSAPEPAHMSMIELPRASDDTKSPRDAGE